MRRPIAVMYIAFACAGGVGSAATAADPFDFVRFFAGRTHGEGRLKVIMTGERGVHVDGDGIMEPDGSLTLVQRVVEDGKPSRTREWQLRRIGPNTYAATLSDAIGPVRIEAAGGGLRIRFRTTEGFGIDQRLLPRPGGRVVLNHLAVRRHGVRVATLDETIRRYD